VRPGFEGGQMPLQRRLPKRGFTNLFKKEYALVNLRDLSRFEANATLDIDALKNAGLVKRGKDGVKVLGNGDISVPLVVRVNRVTKPAREKIEAAGGSVELV
jgi:large subunit ribosomal protein L15